jgi:hypothetical protein
MPRNTSVYPAANKRSGKSAGLRTPRARAISSAMTKMHGADQAKILTSSQKASTSRGNESTNTSPSKNDRRTRCHPGVMGTRTTIAVTTSAVLAAAMMTERRRCARS